ncbi:GIY-YIG nuclease family protein [Daejeonella sp.]|uniref:GIY-YIG nuclease family protein n=1 Tax=Daejeonella sp. TaxID=2805397 RepID=UPI003C79287E
MFFTYILQSQKSKKFYTGHTECIEKRLLRHNGGKVTATRNKGPWVLVYWENFETRSEANRREFEIKSMKSRFYIEKLVASGRTI